MWIWDMDLGCLMSVLGTEYSVWVVNWDLCVDAARMYSTLKYCSFRKGLALWHVGGFFPS